MKYEQIWRNKWLTAHCTTLEEMETALREAADTLRAMREAGVQLDAQGAEDDYMCLRTDDPEVASKYEFDEEEPDDDEGDEDDGDLEEVDAEQPIEA